MTALLLLVLLAPGSPAAEPSCAPTTADDLRARVDAALALWPAAAARRVAPDALRDAVDDVRARLACLTDALDAATAARVHAALGVGAWTAPGGRADARAAFAAGRRADPALRLGDGWDDTPETARLLEAWDDAPVELGCAHPVPRPRRGAFLFDGRADGARSDAWPTLWQALDDRGHVTATAWLRRDDPLPAYRHAPPAGAWATIGVGIGVAVAGAALGAVAGPAFLTCREGGPAAERVACDGAVVGANAAWTLGGIGVGLTVGGAGWLARAVRPRPWSTPHLDVRSAP